MSTIALRPFLPADLKRCAAIFRASIEETASEDYSESQCEAWASRADDAEAFAARLGDALTLIATLDGEAAGFASLKGAAHIDMLFVDPAFGRRGVATTLLDALIKLARARGARKTTSEVSDTAKPVFARMGFESVRRNLVSIGDEWLGNTTMSKSLDATPASPATRH